MPISVETCVRWKEQIANSVAREAINEIKVVRAPKAYDPLNPSERPGAAAYAQGWVDALDALVALADERPKESDTPFRDMTSKT
jgi:hypothetical protein